MADLSKSSVPSVMAPPSEELAHAIEIVRDYVERKRVIPSHILDGLDQNQQFQLFTPKALGGLELHPVEALRSMSAIARLDGSIGWVSMIYAVYSFFSGRLGEKVSAEIFGSGKHRVAGVMAPGGRAVPHGDGYLLTGRWAFASGCQHADWLIVGALVWVDGKPEMTDGVPHVRVFFVPKSQFEVNDTWHVTGLQGTGSHDIALSGVFASAEYSYNYIADESTRPEALYQVPVFPLFSGAVAAATIGMARRAIDSYKHSALKKVTWNADWQQVSLAQKSSAQTDLGRAEMLVDGAEMFLHGAINELSTSAMGGGGVSAAERGRVRAACINASINSVQAVNLLRKRLGTAALFKNHPLEKAFRDINTAAQHIVLNEDGLELVGRLSFGFPAMGAV